MSLYAAGSYTPDMFAAGFFNHSTPVMDANLIRLKNLVFCLVICVSHAKGQDSIFHDVPDTSALEKGIKQLFRGLPFDSSYKAIMVYCKENGYTFSKGTNSQYDLASRKWKRDAAADSLFAYTPDSISIRLYRTTGSGADPAKMIPLLGISLDFIYSNEGKMNRKKAKADFRALEQEFKKWGGDVIETKKTGESNPYGVKDYHGYYASVQQPGSSKEKRSLIMMDFSYHNRFPKRAFISMGHVREN